jgi:hypothetical protein
MCGAYLDFSYLLFPDVDWVCWDGRIIAVYCPTCSLKRLLFKVLLKAVLRIWK